jgi:glycosyltransferase involved in cell wall biosynthesis
MARILLFTPVMPCLTGQGSAIRVGIALEILAEIHEVVVVQLDLWNTHAGLMTADWVRHTATAYHKVSMPATAAAVAALVKEHLAQEHFDGVYVFRLASASFALLVLGELKRPGLPSVVDLDDDECSRTEKFIPLREAVGDFERAAHERDELGRLRRLQRMLLSQFGCNLLASSEDRDALAARYPDQRFLQLPNVVRLQQVERPAWSSAGRRNLLFIGTLNYLPNEDAILYFCSEVLALLRSAVPDVAVQIVGTQASAAVRQCGRLAGVTVKGPVKDVALEYGRARAMIVPLRAGSGTRIKILEAFSFGVPVVSTTEGIAGLNLRNEVHLLIADTPQGFAQACERVLTDDALAARLTRNADAWLRENHTLDAVRELLHSLFR